MKEKRASFYHRTAALSSPKGDVDMTQDDTGSAPMLGSQAAAWAVEHGGDIVYVSIRAHDAQGWAGGGPCDVVPLYRDHPRLSAAEREAIERGADALDGIEDVSAGAAGADASAVFTLRSMLERLR